MTIAEAFKVGLTYNGEKFLFKDVYRVDITRVGRKFYLVVRYKPNFRYQSESFIYKDVSELIVYRDSKGVIAND